MGKFKKQDGPRKPKGVTTQSDKKKLRQENSFKNREHSENPKE